MTDRQLNGVPLFSQKGVPRTRYSLHDRITICGGTLKEFRQFVDLFCPGRRLYARTRGGSDDPRAWTTPGLKDQSARITDEEIAKHLVGDATPGIKPCWVAPRSWEVTKWAGIDVDFRGDTADFRRRCMYVRESLKRLGITRKHILTSRTPSGGRHFRIFFDRKVRVAHIEYVFAKIGLHETPGQIEIFPRLKKGMRLPFGYIPGRQHDPAKWVNFIRNYRRRKWPLISFTGIDELATQVFVNDSNSVTTKCSSNAAPLSLARTDVDGCRSISPTVLGLPRHVLQSKETDSRNMTRFKELMSRPFSSPLDAQHLWQIGILCPGTRTLCTQRLAWHLIHVRKLTPNDAASKLVQWVYETGTSTSTDVMKDNASGTRHVEKQVRSCVEWVASQISDGRAVQLELATLSPEEVQAIRQKLGKRHRDNIRYVSAALRLLRFAKLHGSAAEDGWTVMLAIKGVVRKWPECRGVKNYYKPVIDAFISCGLLTLVKEKLQRGNQSGRPRTYRVNILPQLRQNACFNHDQAMEPVIKQVRVVLKNVVASGETPYTYRMFQHSPSMQLMVGIMEVAEEEQVNSDASPIKQDPKATRDITLSFKERERLALENRFNAPEPSERNEEHSFAARYATRYGHLQDSRENTLVTAGQENLSVVEDIDESIPSAVLFRQMRDSNKGSSSTSCISNSGPPNELKYKPASRQLPSESERTTLDQSRRNERAFRPTPPASCPIEDANYSIPPAALSRGSTLCGQALE